MKIGMIRNAQRPQLVHQLRQQRTQKARVFRAARGGFPAEYAHRARVRIRHDLGRMQRAPLREQMRHFKVFHPRAPRRGHPAAQKRKIKLPALRALAHAHQLHRGALAAHGGIQRRGEQRGQNHIDAPARGHGHKALDQLPVLGGKHGHAIVLRQAVAVKPVGAPQRLLGQKAGQNAHARAGLAEHLARVRVQ